MKKVAAIIFLIGVVSVTSAQTEKAVSIVEPAIFLEETQDGKVQLVDVRTPEEFNEGHLKEAMNIDFLAEGFVDGFSELDKDKPVFIYCRSGNRSGKAAEKLSSEGFNNIIDLKGGYLEMEKYLKENNLGERMEK